MIFGPRPLADQYPKIIEKLFGVRKQRRDFLERLIAPGVAPKGGYRALISSDSMPPRPIPNSSICTDPSNTIQIRIWTTRWISWMHRSSIV